MRIGAKRNLLNRLATGKIIIAMDDDDYYPPTRVSNVVAAFEKNPAIQLAGSSEMLLYYTDTQTIYRMPSYSKKHATNGTMAWRNSYAATHQYDEFVTKAEEQSFLDNYQHPMIQLDFTILVICHEDNTVDKQKLRAEHMAARTIKMQPTSHRLEDIIDDSFLISFYSLKHPTNA